MAIKYNDLEDCRESPTLTIALGYYSIFGCAVFAIMILIADFVVPNHDWISDTISDLGAGRYEFIVDIGIYAFSSSLISISLLSTHIHLGKWPWSLGAIAFATIGLIVFLVGARNEYGDSDNEGFVIHTYLVYALGVLFAAAPIAMACNAECIQTRFRRTLISLAVLWLVSAPIFFIMPDSIDGIYERYLGLIAFAIIITMALLFIDRSQRRSRRQAR